MESFLIRHWQGALIFAAAGVLVSLYRIAAYTGALLDETRALRAEAREFRAESDAHFDSIETTLGLIEGDTSQVGKQALRTNRQTDEIDRLQDGPMW